MQFTMFPSVLLALVVVLSAAWSTSALPILQEREVFDPPITSPKAGDVFKAGQTITVTWDTSSLPAGTPNKGEIILGALTDNSENLDVDHPLASGFLLTAGSQKITFPSTLKTKTNYILDLFGDSGNISDEFTIKQY